MPLDRDSILKASDFKPVRVDVPEWGGEVYVRAMSGMERDRFEQTLFVGKGEDRRLNDNYRARLVCLTACDEKGAALFGIEDVFALGSKSAAALDRIVQVSAKLNGIGEEAAADAKKSSDPVPNSASTSA